MPARPLDVWRSALLASDLTAAAKLVAVAVGEFMDFTTLGSAYPGPARLSAMTGYGERWVKHQLKALVAAGWLAQTRRGGGNLASAYRGSYPKGVKPSARVTGPPVKPSAQTPCTPDPDAVKQGAHHPVIEQGQYQAAAARPYAEAPGPGTAAENCDCIAATYLIHRRGDSYQCMYSR